jgi:hypothetical protein
MKLKTNKTLIKGSRKKIKNQNKEDQIEKNNIINLDWMMILKTNETFQKGQEKNK